MDSRRPRRAENGHANGDRWQGKETLDYNQTLINELLQGRENPSLQGLDMGMIKRKSYDRTRSAMMAINPTIASQVLPQTDHKSEQEKAAIRIQSHMRGYIARRQYCDLLYEQFEKEEQERLEKMRQQVQEGELLVENYKLKAEMDENDCLRRNQRRSLDFFAVTIQRAWRNYRRRTSFQSKNPIQAPNPLSQFVDQPDTHFMIRTNPFQQIRSHGNDNDDEEEDLNDIFNDSLEQATEYNENISASSEYDPLGSGHLDLDSVGIDSVQMEFPSPTTDWESIESCLNSEGEIKDSQQMESPELADKYLTDFSIKAKDLQICFVDDSLSDDGDEDGLEIKEYVIDKQDVSDDEKRDSGCVAGDEEEKESFSIKTVSPDDLVLRNPVSDEESHHVMLELLRHEDRQEKKLTVQGWTVERLCVLTLAEIRALRDNLAQLIQAQNEVLVTELMKRDALHLKQDSMLLEVEDTTKRRSRVSSGVDKLIVTTRRRHTTYN